ncbi:MAG: DUF5693 family protein [Anaerolineae bacterium]
MKLSRLLSLTTAAVGAAAAASVLARRHEWEKGHNRIAICVDFDDAQAAAIRAGLPFTEMLAKLAQAGATHVSLPEWTLDRLRQQGQLTPQAPARPLSKPPRVGHWNYLHGEAGLVARLADELQERLPATEAAVLNQTTLAFAGELSTIGEIGLGFDADMAALIRRHGLGVVPRPVSYAWPDPRLLARTLAQAAQIGRAVAFAGDMILGHEMHLDETVAALEQHGLTFVYFAQSRHQKGDWFIAKRRAPHVVLGHRLTPAEMVPLDYHAACHNWAHFARERGIRFCYVNFFRVLHATAPLEGLDYVHHLKHALEDAGFVVAAEIDLSTPVPAPEANDLALVGLAAAGVGATAVSDLFNLPETLAVPLTITAAAGAATLPYAEQLTINNQRLTIDHAREHHHGDHHHHDHKHEHSHANLHALYPPSYAPKLLALTAAALGPVASLRRGGIEGAIYQAAAAGALAAVTSGQAYQLRIEEYRGFNLDWLLPLSSAAMQLPSGPARAGLLAALAAAWLAARQRNLDILALADPGHAEGHTHHISAAMALLGDIQMAIGPKPARKWAGLGPLAGGLSVMLARNGRSGEAGAAALLAALGYALGLVGLRRPERALQDTLREAGPSFAVGTAVGLLLTWIRDAKERE